MSTPDLSKAHCPSFFKTRKPKAKKKSAAEKREGMSAKHIALIQRLPCCVCQIDPGGTAHHLKLGVESRGLGMRAPDKCTVPLCGDCHLHGIERAGSRNEWDWFSKRGINCLDLAQTLWDATGDLDAMRERLRDHLRDQQEKR